MTKNTVNETERMVITRVFDAPRALVWEAWTNPKYVMQWWGPKGFTAPFCEMDFRVGGKFLCCMRAPDGQEGWNAGEYHEIVLHEKIVSSMYFSDPQGNKVEPAESPPTLAKNARMGHSPWEWCNAKMGHPP